MSVYTIDRHTWYLPEPFTPGNLVVVTGPDGPKQYRVGEDGEHIPAEAT